MTVRGLLLCFVLGCAASVAAQSLPDGPGADIARKRCLTCHGADLIVQQRLSRAGWEREVDKMTGWGAGVTAEERAPLVDYFAARFAPKPAASHEERAASSGEATFTRACLVCHGKDIIEQQRLTPAGWTREVEKMVRWGASVPDADKEALVAFLAARYR